MKLSHMALDPFKIIIVQNAIYGNVNMICPNCKKDLGEPISVDLYTNGWCCTDCKVKIYQELQ